MEGEILKIASTQGMWVTLTVVLIFYILRNQEKRDLKQDERDKNYQEMILNLTNKFNIIDDMIKSIEEIKYYLSKK